MFGRPPTLVWLYVFIVLILGATLLTGVVSWVWLTFEDRALPTGLATVLATIAGRPRRGADRRRDRLVPPLAARRPRGGVRLERL
jgi:hypothetical protein